MISHDLFLWVRNWFYPVSYTHLSQIQPGDAVVVRAGGIIPVDGLVLEGEVTVNQASLTGESIPVPKRPGGAVYAGTVVEEGECVLEVKQASGQKMCIRDSRNIVQRHSQGQHGRLSKTAFDALSLRAAAVQMRDQPIQSQQEKDAEPETHNGGDKGPPPHVRCLLHRGQQQAPDGSRHHDPRRKAGERTLYHLTQIVPHKKDAGRPQRRCV